VSGWTHNFYRYPARFSPNFARAAIEEFSLPGDLIADPYMGGGTSVVEGVIAGRHVVGNDLNALASFISRVKTTFLSGSEVGAIERWARDEVPDFGYGGRSRAVDRVIDPVTTHNLSLVRARFIKKALARAIVSMEMLPSSNAQAFARCAILAAGQWALDGRRRHTSLAEFRERLTAATLEMLRAIQVFGQHAAQSGGSSSILNMDAASLDTAAELQGRKISLVVTSPPYPGVHVLYHRWQVDGRRETPAPYWITGCNDGQAAAFYNFGHRLQRSGDEYFETSLRTLHAIRRVTLTGGHMVQLIAFNRPADQLPRYLANMEAAGFAEVATEGRIWRQVPNRKWHATLRGKTHSAREVVLVHEAV
jgi:hypothetical protein